MGGGGLGCDGRALPAGDVGSGAIYGAIAHGVRAKHDAPYLSAAHDGGASEFSGDFGAGVIFDSAARGMALRGNERFDRMGVRTSRTMERSERAGSGC